MNQSRRGLILSCLLSFGFLFLVFLIANVAKASERAVDSLAPAGQGDFTETALEYIRENREQWGLTSADVDGLVLVDQYTSRHNSLTHLYFWQTHAGLEVSNAILNLSLAPDGRVVHVGNRLVPGVAARANSVRPALAADRAVRAAASALKLTLAEPLVVQQALGGAEQEVLFSDGGISLQPIPAKLVYQPREKGDGVRLAWDVEIYELDAEHYWSVRIDALDGSLLAQYDYVAHDTWGAPDHSHGATGSSAAGALASPANPVSLAAPPLAPESPDAYLVYAIPKEYPDDGPRTLEADPANLTASPLGWHDTNGAAGAEYSVTRGNNVHAYTDTDDNNLPDAGSDPDGGAGLVFSYTMDLAQEPATYRDAAVTNLFYWNNVVHDVFYLYGFDEPSGNFQVNNYGNGGAGGDDVMAEAQDGSGTNNANFASPPDGTRPRMQMFLWSFTTPGRDGDLSSMIVAHEYGHGISTRLAGGPGNSLCLQNNEQMGEGWSDFFGLVLTASPADVGTTSRGVGTYVLGQTPGGPGIRPTPYATDLVVNPTTYGDISGLAIPHGVGYAWASIIWEVYWALVEEHGFNPDIYGDWTTGGNNLALQLVVDGLKLQPCSPGFVDGRNAILQADVALTGGANGCLLWEAFAKRGLGFSASQGSSASTLDGVEAFDTPAACEFMSAQPATQNICAGTPAVYEVRAGTGYTPPVTLSASGAPAGTTTTFATNPFVTVPSTTTMTIGNTAGAAAGTYTITVTGSDATSSESVEVGLDLASAPPGSTSLIAPADGAGNVSFQPAFAWSSAAQAQSYLLEVDDDPAFGSVDYSATVEATAHVAATPLAASTTYYWRVTPQNVCGAGSASATYSFTVQASSLICNGAALGFEGGIPFDWSVLDASAGGAGIDWTTTADAACNIPNATGGSGEAACADSDAAGSGAPAYDTHLTSPPIDLSAVYSASLDLKAYYNDLTAGANDFFDVDVWNGASWSTVLHWDEDHSATNLSLDLSSYAGLNAVQVRFRYAGDGWDWYAEVDDVELLCELAGLELSPGAQQSGSPGDDVVYSVQITNTGTTTDTFDLGTAGNSWTTVLSDISVTLGSGASATVDVTVSIPAGAGDGDADSVDFTATSQTDPSKSDTVTLETTAEIVVITYDLYLPAIFKP